MKVKRVHISFVRAFDVSVFVPEDATDEQIQAATNKAIGSLEHAWDLSDSEWKATVLSQRLEEIPDAECAAEDDSGICVPVEGLFRGVEAVLSDERDDLVSVGDATWWIVGKEEGA